MAERSDGRWGDKEFTPVEVALIDAALRLGVTNAVSCTFMDVVTEAKKPKGSAYRTCSDGMPGVLELLHRDTVRTVFTEAHRSLRRRHLDANFTSVVHAGIDGVLVGLKEARWTGEVLWRDRDAVTAYLLRRGEGGIYARLVGFATWCAENRGADAEVARTHAQDLVWGVLTTAVAALSPTPGDPPNWPATVGPDLKNRVSDFASAVGLKGHGAPGPFLPSDAFLVDEPGQEELESV